MMEFFKTLAVAAALLSLSLLFLPEKPGLRRASQTVFSLLFLLLLIPKDGSFVFTDLLPTSSADTVEAEDIYKETLSASVTAGVKADLVSRFSLDPSALSLETDLSLSESALSGSYLRLYLGKENFFADASSILRYVKNTYSLECEVHFVGNQRNS